MLEVGEIVFGHYEILHAFQRGPSDGLFLARHSDFPDARCTLKAMKLTESTIEDLSAQRFRNEILVTYELQHPNIIRSRGYHREDQLLGLVMEYLPYGNLRDIIKTSQVVQPGQLIYTLGEVLLGLSEIHKSGIIHRDMRPENILFGSNEEIKITDFGDARVGATISTGSGITGQLEYLSPEYVRDGTLTAASDIYSLGICAYEVITGTMPYKADSPIRALALRLTQEIVPPHQLVPECPEALSDIVVKAMQIDPGTRYQSAEEMIQALNEFSEKTGILPEPLIPEDPPVIPGALPLDGSLPENSGVQAIVNPAASSSENKVVPKAEKVDKKATKRLVGEVFHGSERVTESLNSLQGLMLSKKILSCLAGSAILLALVCLGVYFNDSESKTLAGNQDFAGSTNPDLYPGVDASGTKAEVPPGWYVEYLSSTDVYEAGSVAESLAEQGFPLEVQTLIGAGAIQFKVLIGPFEDESLASLTMGELDESGLYKPGISVLLIGS